MARPRNFPNRVRRKRQWIRETLAPTEVLNGVTVAFNSITESEYSGVGFGDSTVVRIRGIWVISPDPVTMNAQGESQRFGLGIITLRGGSAGAGIEPLTDLNESWMWWHASTITLQDDGTGGLDFAGVGVNRVIEYDVKAMRVLRGKDNLQSVVQNSGDSDAHFFISHAWSVLLQE